MNCGLNLRKKGSPQAIGDTTPNEIRADKRKTPTWKHSIDANRQIIMHGVNKAFLIKLGQIKDKKMQLCNNTYQNP